MTNTGTGNGYSVLDIVSAFEKVSKRRIPYKMTARRPGDIAVCYADPTKAMEELGWTAKKRIEEMCEDSWRWQTENPNGYVEKSSIVKEMNPKVGSNL